MFTCSDLAKLAGVSKPAIARKIQKAGISPARIFTNGKSGRPEYYYNDNILELFPRIDTERAKEYLREQSVLLSRFSYVETYRIEVIEDVDEDLDEDSEWGFECEAQNEEEAEAELREILTQPDVIAARLETTMKFYTNWVTK